MQTLHGFPRRRMCMRSASCCTNSSPATSPMTCAASRSWWWRGSSASRSRHPSRLYAEDCALKPAWMRLTFGGSPRSPSSACRSSPPIAMRQRSYWRPSSRDGWRASRCMPVRQRWPSGRGDSHAVTGCQWRLRCWSASLGWRQPFSRAGRGSRSGWRSGTVPPNSRKPITRPCSGRPPPRTGATRPSRPACWGGRGRSRRSLGDRLKSTVSRLGSMTRWLSCTGMRRSYAPWLRRRPVIVW